MCWQVALADERQYHDVFTLQKVSGRDIANFNFVSGMVFFVFNLCIEVRRVSRKGGPIPIRDFSPAPLSHT